MNRWTCSQQIACEPKVRMEFQGPRHDCESFLKIRTAKSIQCLLFKLIQHYLLKHRGRCQLHLLRQLAGSTIQLPSEFSFSHPISQDSEVREFGFKPSSCDLSTGRVL